jgi:hypothetical protein
VRLIAPYELQNLYNNRHCYSSVNLDAIDYDQFPLFRNVTVIDVEIGPGDLCFSRSAGGTMSEDWKLQSR